MRLLVLLLIPSLCQAFMNIESIRNSDQQGFVGKLGMKYQEQSGNTEKMNTQIENFNLYRTKKTEYLGLARYQYGESSDHKDTHNGHIHLRATMEPFAARSYEFFTQIEFNEFKDLSLRSLLGTGLRFRLSKTKSTVFYLGTGVFYENEEFKISGDQNALRGNIYLSFLYEQEGRFSINIISYYQPKADQASDYRLKNSLGFETKLTAKLSFTTEAIFSYDSEPVNNVVKQDVQTISGLSYKY